jgi:ABC transporter substrate binding protein
MKRREFITLLGGATAWPLTISAQQPPRMREVAIWMGRPNDVEGKRHATAFREGLEALGWAVGRNIRTDYRWVTGDIDRTGMAKEIVEQQPDVIVVETTVGIEALARESRTIPIIFVNVADPIISGFVANLAHPGGNITGFISNEPTLGGKWPELLKEIAPEVRRVGFLFNPGTASYAESARASTPGGMVRPSVLAVLRLITSSNLVGCKTGRSVGFAPLRMRPV